MVCLAVDFIGVTEAIQLARQYGCAVWVGSDAISEPEHKQLIQAGLNVTRFSYPLSNASADMMQGTLDTVNGHHPNDVIWVQHRDASNTGFLES